MSQQATVFLVEDEPDVRRVWTQVAASLGAAVEVYSSAEEFLAAYDPNRPGCLLTDLKMHGMSGVDLLELLRERSITLPSVLVSAYADVDIAVRAMQAGAVTVLQKPCPLERLEAALKAALAADLREREQRARVIELCERLRTLTDGERAVLHLVVDGKLNKVIADELQVSLRTVELRRHNVLKKMRAESVAALVEMVVQLRQADALDAPPPRDGERS